MGVTMTNNRYILYARKSTDVEDKQVLSIEAQLAELRKFAKDNGLLVVDTIIEKKSAKMPGRAKFAAMLERIQAGEANAILAWHPDRLARNSIDGGQLIYLLDQRKLADLKFQTFWFENTSQGKFMLNIAFGQSKYYVDNLSENTKRGLRQKVRRGEYPSNAPFGYYNNTKTKTIHIDKMRAALVVEIFELYARNESRFQDIADYLFARGVKTKGGKVYKPDKVKKILTNPFYYGHFVYGGELHEGKHTPLMSKKLFDEVQAVIAQRCFRQQDHTREPMPYCGLLKCPCGMMVTAENKTKRQKNGNVHNYVYYRCSRKSKNVACVELPVRSEPLDEQLSGLLVQFALPDGWANYLRQRIDEDERSEQGANTTIQDDLRGQVAQISGKLQRLLDTFLDEVIDRQTYTTKKAELMSQKKSLEEQMSNLALGECGWVEPMRSWLDKAVSICSVAQTDDFSAKKSLLLEIFGLNLFLSNKNVAENGYQFQISPQKTPWFALRATREKTAQRAANSEFFPFLEPRSGLEPETSSFAYTSISWRIIRGLDCILSLSFDVASLVSRSGLSFRIATVLPIYAGIDRYSGFILQISYASGQESCDPPWMRSTS